MIIYQSISNTFLCNSILQLNFLKITKIEIEILSEGQIIFPLWLHIALKMATGTSLGLRPATERRRYIVTASFIGWVQT